MPPIMTTETDDEVSVQRAVAQFVPRLEAAQITSSDSWIRVSDSILDRDRDAHGRFAKELSERLGAVTVALAQEREVVRFRLYERGRMVDEYLSVPSYYGELSKGDELALDGFVVRVIRTPGHTPGSTCLIVGNNLFSGDTLLPGAPGRTDLPGGDKKKLAQTLEELRQLDAGYVVHPGHGKPFALGEFWSKFDDK